MEQSLGRENRRGTGALDADPIHPSQALIEAITDSQTRRERHVEGDEVLLFKAGQEIRSTEPETPGTINGYTPEHQRALRNMLGKDAWRS